MSRGAGRWTLGTLLMLATTLNYLDRQTVGILAPTIQREMGLDNEALGWLFAGFYYAYTLAQFGVGWLLDRGNVRLIYGLAVAGWSLAAGLTGLARGFVSLLAFRILLGVMESANWPGAMRMVALRFPPEERAFANGLFTSGTSIGAVIAPSIILGIAAFAGWRSSFGLVGLLGLLWITAWIPYTRSSPLADPALARPPAAGAGNRYARALGKKQFWLVFAITITVNPSLYFFLNWLPTFLSQRFAVSTSSSMAVMLTGSYLALDFGNLSAGAMVYLFLRLGWKMHTARRQVFVIASLLAVAASVIPAIHDRGEVLALTCCVTFALGLWVSMYLTLAQEVDPDNVSTVAGLLGGSGAFAGAVAMWAVGRITTRTGSFAVPLAGVTAAILIAGVAGWAATAPGKNIKALQGGAR
jgi:MFS transporter, ACS family, hexuronate transporter